MVARFAQVVLINTGCLEVDMQLPQDARVEERLRHRTPAIVLSAVQSLAKPILAEHREIMAAEQMPAPGSLAHLSCKLGSSFSIHYTVQICRIYQSNIEITWI